MFKNLFLFITTFLVATSVSTGYGSSDILKGNVNVTTFLDWFSKAESHVHPKGLLLLDLIPIFFLLIQTFLFFKEGKKGKGVFAVLALLANLIGVFLVMQNANPLAAQMVGWTPDNIPTDWVSIKDKWIDAIGLSGLLGIVGWLCFVITFFISETRDASIKRLPGFLNFAKNAIAFFLLFSIGMGATRIYDLSFFPYPYEIAGPTFIEMHRPVDIAISKVGPYLFTFIVTLLLLLTTFLFMEKSRQKGWLIIAALIFLLCDTFIALQCNGPLNDLFLSWTPMTIPANWSGLRDQWLSYHQYRNVFMTLMFFSLMLMHFVPFKKNTPLVS